MFLQGYRKPRRCRSDLKCKQERHKHRIAIMWMSGSVIKDQCEKDTYIIQQRYSFSVQDIIKDTVFDHSNDPPLFHLVFQQLSFCSPRTHPLSVGCSTAAVQLENDGLRAILMTLYVFSPGASKPGDKPRLSNV